MSDYAPTNATMTVAANGQTVTINGVDLTGIVLPGMNLYIGSRTLKQTGYKIQGVTIVSSTQATLAMADPIPTAYTNAPFIIDTLGYTGSGTSYVASLYVRFLAVLQGLLGDLTSLATNARQIVLDKGAATTFARYAFSTGGRLWAEWTHQATSASGNERIKLRVFPDGSTAVDALVVDAASGGVDHKAAAYTAPTIMGSNQSVDIDSENAKGFRKIGLTPSGTVTIASLGTGKHVEKLLIANGAITFVNSATLVCPGAANLTLAAGDTAWAYSDGAATPVFYLRNVHRATQASVRADIGAYGSGDSPTFGTLTANNLYATGGGGIFFRSGSGATTGWDAYAAVTGGSSAANGRGAFGVYAATVEFYSTQNGRSLYIQPQNDRIYSSGDNTTSLGLSTNRWSNGYFVGLTSLNANIGGGPAISGLATFGSGSGNAAVAVNGGGSGTNGGSTVQFYNGGGLIGGVGGASAVLGGSYDAAMTIYGASGVRISTGPNWIFNTSGHLLPYSNGTQNLGGAGNSYANLYVTNNPIVGSDQKLKTKGRPLPDNLLAAAREFEIVLARYKQAKEEKAELGIDSRKHTVVMAQQILASCDRHGVDGFRHGFVGRDQDKVEKVTMVKSRRGKTVQREVFDLVRQGDVMVRRSRMVDEPVMLTLPVLDEAGRPAIERRTVQKLNDDGSPVLSEREVDTGERDGDGNPVLATIPEPVFEERDVPVTHQVQDEEECEVEHRETVPAVNDNGEPIYTLSVRYEQVWGCILAAERQRGDGLEARIADLEAKLAA